MSILGVPPALPRPALPPVLNIGYANWGECGDGKIEAAAANGVNLVIWFALSLVLGDRGEPLIKGGPNLTCVARTAALLEKRGLPTTHFVSIGGWSAPHPSPTLSAPTWWGAFAAYDAQAEAAGLRGGFDGIDWDLEGSDTRSSPSNTFHPATLRLVSDLSVLAKASGKYVSLAPPQSYLDCTTPEFSFSLLHSARCWRGGSNGSEFTYAGRNAYAALLALAPSGTYDFISLQLYESYSIASCMLTERRTPLASYLASLVQSMHAGWEVGFDREPLLGLGNRTVRVARTSLVIGLANGWTRPGGKALFVKPDELAHAWRTALTPEARARPRGFMFWDVSDEGKVPTEGAPPLYLARQLNAFLHTRPRGRLVAPPNAVEQRGTLRAPRAQGDVT